MGRAASRAAAEPTGPESQSESRVAPGDDQDQADEQIRSLSAARSNDGDDRAAVDALLARAAERNRPALDRLAR